MVLLRSSSVRLRLLLLLLLLLEKRLSEMSDDLRKRTQKSAKIEKTKKMFFEKKNRLLLHSVASV